MFLGHRIKANHGMLREQQDRITTLETDLSKRYEERLASLERGHALERVESSRLIERLSDSMGGINRQAEQFMALEKSLNETQREFSVAIATMAKSIDHVVDEMRLGRESAERDRREVFTRLGSHDVRLARIEASPPCPHLGLRAQLSPGESPS